MKYSVISLAFVAALAAAQDGIPKCAVSSSSAVVGCKPRAPRLLAHATGISLLLRANNIG